VAWSVKLDSFYCVGYLENAEGVSDHRVGVSSIYPFTSLNLDGVAPNIYIVKRGVARGVAPTPAAGVKSHLFRLGVPPIGVMPAAILVAVRRGVSHLVELRTD